MKHNRLVYRQGQLPKIETSKRSLDKMLNGLAAEKKATVDVRKESAQKLKILMDEGNSVLYVFDSSDEKKPVAELLQREFPGQTIACEVDGRIFLLGSTEVKSKISSSRDMRKHIVAAEQEAAELFRVEGVISDSRGNIRRLEDYVPRAQRPHDSSIGIYDRSRLAA